MTDTPATVLAEYDISPARRDNERWKLRIFSDVLEFSGEGVIHRIAKSEAPQAVSLNVVQVGGAAFSVVLPKTGKELFKCTKQAYEHLEQWFGYENLIRMEFQHSWVAMLMMGVFLLYSSIRALDAGVLRTWNLIGIVSSVLIVVTPLIGRVYPAPSLYLLSLLGWVLIAVRSILILALGGGWFNILPLVLAVFCMRYVLRRYTRLTRAKKVS